MKRILDVVPVLATDLDTVKHNMGDLVKTGSGSNWRLSCIAVLFLLLAATVQQTCRFFVPSSPLWEKHHKPGSEHNIEILSFLQ